MIRNTQFMVFEHEYSGYHHVWGLKVTEKDLSQFLLMITHKIETDQPYHHSDGMASCCNKNLI